MPSNLKQHAHVEIVTVTDADLIHIELAIVNNLRNCDLISNCSQFLKLFTIASCKLHLSMLSSVWLCCLSDIALILVTFQKIQEKVLRNCEKYESSAAPRIHIFHSFFGLFPSYSEKLLWYRAISTRMYSNITYQNIERESHHSL